MLGKLIFACNMYQASDNIIALSTPMGFSALAMVRLSGPDVINVSDRIFTKNIENAKGYTLHYGYLEKLDGQTIDEVVLSVYRAPNSFTGEDMIEISCHGSPVIAKLIIAEFTKMQKVRMASPGEFSLRAFQNKKMDLVKAESIADLIHSETEAAHHLAINQLRDGFSSKLEGLRKELIDFAALFELELDFGEEDVEFAQRDKMIQLCKDTNQEIGRLVESFDQGNAIKTGIPTAIVGKPNAGKSTLLNALLNDNRAIVSAIAGTTRDTIEEKLNIKGIQFNLIDTAGLRDSTSDEIEEIGISKAIQVVKKAKLILYLVDAAGDDHEIVDDIKKAHTLNSAVTIVFTKTDQLDASQLIRLKEKFEEAIFISASANDISHLLLFLETKAVEINTYGGSLITNQRHLEALQAAKEANSLVLKGLEEGNYAEQIASDLKSTLFFLGSITGGTISANDVLSSVFSNFCIGK